MKLKICIVAAPSCDKTTVAREVVKILKKNYGINAEIVEEYARKYIRDNYVDEHPLVDPHQQYPIMLGQIELEQKIGNLHDVVVCDSSSFLGYIYAALMVQELPPEQKIKPMYLKVLKDLHEIALKEISTYDKIFLFSPTGSVFQDGVRKQTDDDQVPIFEKIRGFLLSESINFVHIDGDVNHKTQAIISIVLPKLRKLGLVG